MRAADSNSSSAFDTISRPARPVRTVERFAEIRFIVGSARREAAAKTPRTVSAFAGVVVANRISVMPTMARTKPISSRYRGASETMPIWRAARARRIRARRKPSMNALALEVSRASRKPSSPGRRNCQACSPASAISSPIRYCLRRSISCTPNTNAPNRTTAKIVTAGDAIASTAVIPTSTSVSVQMVTIPSSTLADWLVASLILRYTSLIRRDR